MKYKYFTANFKHVTTKKMLPLIGLVILGLPLAVFSFIGKITGTEKLSSVLSYADRMCSTENLNETVTKLENKNLELFVGCAGFLE